jgi:hypothetical protein
VEISNAGDGTLDWLAQEDAPWLALSATESTSPSTLELTADPAGQVDGTVLSTTLWITSPASAERVTERVAIPVSLRVGDVYRIYCNTVWDSVYLPLVLRGFGS